MNREVNPSRSGGHSAYLGALDQAFSSASNGLIIFAIAIGSSPDSFGQFAVAITAMMAILGCARGAIGLPLLHKADAPPDAVAEEASYALGFTLIVGPIIACAVLFSAPPITLEVAVLAASTPLILCQDALRHASMSVRNPGLAAFWGGIWFTGTLAILAATWSEVHVLSASMIVAIWGALGAAGFVGMMAALRVRPKLVGLGGWVKQGWRDRCRYASDAGLEQVTVLAALAISAHIVGTQTSGAIRGAMALLAPIAIIGAAVQLVTIPESVRRATPPNEVWRKLVRIGVIVAALTAVIGLILIALPTTVGRYLLGDTFDSAQAILPLVVLEYMASCLIAVLGIYLRTFNRSAAVLRMKIAAAATSIVGVLFASSYFGTTVGVAAALALSTFLVAAGAVSVVAPWKPTDR